MAKFNLCRQLFTIQLICMTISTILVNVEAAGMFNRLFNTCTSVTRSLVRIPSKVADGSQYATQKVMGTVGNAVGPVRPLKRIIDATGGAMSNVMGSTSRLLGKTVKPPPKIIFLYSRPLKHLGTSRTYQEAVRTVIAYALTNVVLHKNEMDKAARTVSLEYMPVLQSVVENLKRAGASDNDVADIVSVLGRNGKQDLPVQIQKQVLGVLKDTNGNFKSDGPMEELRWIARHPHGFYEMDDKERTDYKLKTQKKYTTCTVLHPLSFDIKNT